VELADPEVRADLTERLLATYAGRPVIVGPGILAARTELVAWLREVDATVLAITYAHGAGPKPAEGDCVVVDIEAPPTSNVTEEMRVLDDLARHLPDHAVAAVEAFDPDRQGVWVGGPFVTTDEPVLGRPVVSGRPQAFLALEDKLLADAIWEAAGVARAPYEIVPVDRDALADATEGLSGPLGAVWSGDTKQGFNGGGDYVRWVRDEGDQQRAVAWFLPRCDRVRVLPFLDGVPCSIHGIVLPDGTAALRPVEISILRDEATRTFRYGGLSTYWDAPPPDRVEMRTAARKVGEHLREHHGYRGAFGIDGVLTAEGFRPTELNTRASAGFTQVTQIDRKLFSLLQDALVLGQDPGVRVADVEALLPLIDAEPGGRAVALAKDVVVGDVTEALTWDGHSFEISSQDPGVDAEDVLVMADTPAGLFAKVQPCSALAPGVRLSTVNLALYDLLRREYGVDLGDLTAAPDLRRG
jgi:hypothetical protein